MLLTPEEKKMLFEKDLKSEILDNKTEAVRFFNDVCGRFLLQFGIPLPPSNNTFRFVARDRNFNGQFDDRNVQIILCTGCIGHNNFQYLHTALHEATHLLQSFLVKNGISRNSIDNISLKKFQKMCRKFYGNRKLEVSQEMYQNFKTFVKENPFLEDDRMKYIIQDMIKYRNFGQIYYNNVAEIMANDFAARELGLILEQNPVTKEQSKQARKCIDKDEEKIDKISPKRKLLTSIAQNLLTLPHNHLRHIITMSKANLSFKIENRTKLMNDLQYEVSENAKDTRATIKIKQTPLESLSERKKELLVLREYVKENHIAIADTINERYTAFIHCSSINEVIFHINNANSNDEVHLDLDTLTLYYKENAKESVISKEQIEQTRPQFQNNKTEIDTLETVSNDER